MRPIYSAVNSALLSLRAAMKTCHEEGRPDLVVQLEVLERQAAEIKRRLQQED